MIDLKRLIQCENESPATYAEIIRRPYGVLFYNLQNPESHDSNHAVIYDPEPHPGEVIDEITSFYEQRGLVSSQPLYLCSSNPTAIRIYEEIGFVDIGFPVPSWAAHRKESRAVLEG